MSVTLVNLFTVPPEEEANFVDRFKAMAERCEGLAGFERTELHRNAGVGDPSYAFVNIAVWESAEAWRSALPIILQSAGGLGTGVIPKPALYESVFRFPS
jgi:heme oxygenase (mycobilin-producing)